jgi:hypothetical protein
MNWLTVVELDILPHVDATVDPYEADEQYENRRRQLLGALLAMIKDPLSPLYSGFVSCKIDPTYSKNFPDGSGSEDIANIFSTDETVLKIMNKYKDVNLPDQFIDVSHFVIYLSFEGRIRPLLVPNPLLLRKRNCNIWPFEVKDTLG